MLLLHLPLFLLFLPVLTLILHPMFQLNGSDAVRLLDGITVLLLIIAFVFLKWINNFIFTF